MKFDKVIDSINLILSIVLAFIPKHTIDVIKQYLKPSERIRTVVNNIRFYDDRIYFLLL